MRGWSQVHTPAPDLTKDRYSIFPDRARKLQLVGERYRQAGGHWFMALDADDLVSSRLVDFVLNNPNPNGYIARHGYILDQQSGAMAILPHPDIFNFPFDQIAGCTILRLDEVDFSSSEQTYPQCRFARYVGLADHRKLWQMSLDDKRPLFPLPFPAFVYVWNTGDNHSFLHGRYHDERSERLLPALHAKAMVADKSLKNEFALGNPLWGSSEVNQIQSIDRPDDGFRIEFIGCGAQKSGTTSLAHYIKLHPQVGMGVKKEIHFFNMGKFFNRSSPNYTHFHNQFQRSAHAKIYGDVHSAYMYESFAMERIFAYNPKIKILAILRNPIERAFSHWNMQVRDGHETLPFFKALRREAERDRSMAPYQNWMYSYIARGFYTEQIRRIYRLFPPEQTLFLKFDDLTVDPEFTMSKVFTFLGIEPIKIPQAIRVNEGRHDTAVPAEERAFLRHIFEFEIRSLERILGWDCSSWLD